MKLKIYPIAAFCFFIASASAQAKDWERLPDGRVVIEIKGEKLAFTTTDYDLDYIGFHLGDEGTRIVSSASNLTRLTLRDVVDRPELARRAFEAKGGLEAVLVVPPRKHSKNGILMEEATAQGKFDPKTLARDFGAGWRTFYIWFGTTRLYGTPQTGRSWMIHPCDYSLGKYRTLVSEKDKYGYYVTQHIKGKDSYYCLPSENRAFKTPRELRIECRPSIGGKNGQRSCTAWFYGAKRNIEIGYSFNDKDFPQSDWRDLDGRMHAYYSYIIQSQELE